jgi:hypothetical protein
MGLGGERTCAAVQPVLEVLQPTHCGQRVIHRVVLEEPALADDLSLLVHHPLDVARVEAVIICDGLGEGVLRFLEREPECRLDQLLTFLALEVHRDAAGLPEDADDVAEQIGELGEGGEWNVEDRDLLLQLHRQLEHGGEDDSGGVAALQCLAELTERADEAAVVEPGVEILEHHQRRLLQPAEGLERRVRLLCLRRESDAAGVVEPVEAAHGGPSDERLAVAASDAPQQLLDPALLRGHEVDERVACADERVQLSDEARPTRGGDGSLCCLGHGVPAA